MNAIIYAAGRGMRLGDSYGTVPKILLKFEEQTLLEWHLKRLTAVGVSNVTVITGFENGLIREEMERLAPKYGVTFNEVLNRDFTEGSVLSFQVSLPVLKHIDEPMLLMDGDVLYPVEMLQRLIQSEHKTCLLIDRDYSTADDDPLLVPIANGRPIDFVKQWSGEADEVGESIGFFKVAPEDISFLASETNSRSSGERRNESYDEVLRALVKEGRFGHEDVTGLPWTEIDFPGDVKRAETEVLPAIHKLA